jgi:hypothetical protein
MEKKIKWYKKNTILCNIPYYLVWIAFIIIMVSWIVKGCLDIPTWKIMFLIVGLIIYSVWRDELYKKLEETVHKKQTEGKKK